MNGTVRVRTDAFAGISCPIASVRALASSSLLTPTSRDFQWRHTRRPPPPRPLGELDRLTMRRQLDAHFPSGLPGREGVLSLGIDQALMLRRPLLGGIRHRDAHVLPLFFQW